MIPLDQVALKNAPSRVQRGIRVERTSSLSRIARTVAVGVATLAGVAVLALPAQASELSTPNANSDGVSVLAGPGVHGGFAL